MGFFSLAFFMMPVMLAVTVVVFYKKGVKCGALTGFIFTAIIIIIAVTGNDDSGVRGTSRITHYEGQYATLDNGLSSVMAATREGSYDALYSAVSEKNIQGLQSLILSGEAVYLDKGTKVMIVEKTFTSGTKVRVLEGVSQGQEFWVPGDWIK